MDLNPLSLLLGAGAALLVGVSKTGMPGVAIPAVVMMALAFPEDTRLSVGALLPLLLVADVFAISRYRRHAQWDRLWRLLPFVAVGMVPGYLVLAWIDTTALRVLLGILVLTLFALELCRRWIGWFEMRHRIWFTALAGTLTGFGTTVGNAAGPLMTIYLASHRLDKHEFIGTAAWFFFLVNMSKLPFFTALGMITPATLGFDLLLLPVVALGAVAGLYVFTLIPQKLFDVLVLALAGIAGAWIILA